jgi:hypothetical protein
MLGLGAAFGLLGGILGAAATGPGGWLVLGTLGALFLLIGLIAIIVVAAS